MSGERTGAFYPEVQRTDTVAFRERAEKIESAARYVLAATDGTHDTVASHDHSKCLPWALDVLRAAVKWSGER